MTAILSEETRLRDRIVRTGKSLFDRRLTAGSTGNISVRLDDGLLLMTPTNACLGELEPERLSLVDGNGVLLSGDAPTKEAFLHGCVYCQRGGAQSVIHLHSRHSVAVSILDEVDRDNVIPPLTAYYVMRVGTLPLIEYYPPGDKRLAGAVEAAAREHHAMLLSNHGPVVAGRTLEEAQYAIEELEETAALFLLLEGRAIRPLSADQVLDLQKPD